MLLFRSFSKAVTVVFNLQQNGNYTDDEPKDAAEESTANLTGMSGKPHDGGNFLTQRKEPWAAFGQ